MAETDKLTGTVVVENVLDTERDEVRGELIDNVSPRPSDVDDSSTPGEDRETSEEAETAETPVVADQGPSHPVVDADVNQSTAVIPRDAGVEEREGDSTAVETTDAERRLGQLHRRRGHPAEVG